MTADVIVVGAGIVGLAVARKVARSGYRVIVVDREEPGMRASWAAAGMIAPQSEAEGPWEFVSLLLKARAGYPSFVREIEEETGGKVGYRTDGMLAAAFDEAELHQLNTMAGWQEEMGMPVGRLSGEEARRLEPILSEETLGAMLFADDHQVDNRLLTRAFEKSAVSAGAQLRIGVAARGIEASPGSAIVVLEDGTVLEGDTVVLAAGSWSGLIEGLPTQLPVEPVHGQLFALEMASPPIRHLLSGAGSYLVPRNDGRLIVGATSEHVGFRAAVTPGGLRELTTAALRLAPALADRPVIEQWSGLRPGTPDRLPILGPDPEMPRLIYATGHYRNGILLAPITGEIVGTLAVAGAVEENIEPYRVDRFRSGA